MKAKNKAILYVLFSALGFAFMNLFVKMAGDLPFLQKCFFRNFVAMFFASGIVIKQKISLKQPKDAMKHIWLRSIFGGLGMLCNFYAIDRLVIADASMLNKLSPFFAILFSIFFIKEKPKLYQLLCVVVAFIGALFILKPGMDGILSFPAFMGMLGGAGAGFAYTNVRLATAKGADKPFIVLFFSTFTSLLCLPGMIISFKVMTGFQWFCMIMTGACATVGQMGITTAYSLAKASEISVYDYTMIIFAAILGAIFLHEIPDGYSFVGYGIIIGAGIVMFLLNNRKKENS